MNGALASLASRRAISVLPTPVGPIIRMFLGVISLAQRLVDLLAAPAVAQRDRDGALGVGLADDVLVEFGDDLLRASCDRRMLRQCGSGCAHSVSITWFWLV